MTFYTKSQSIQNKKKNAMKIQLHVNDITFKIMQRKQAKSPLCVLHRKRIVFFLIRIGSYILFFINKSI